MGTVVRVSGGAARSPWSSALQCLAIRASLLHDRGSTTGPRLSPFQTSPCGRAGFAGTSLADVTALDRGRNFTPGRQKSLRRQMAPSRAIWWVWSSRFHPSRRTSVRSRSCRSALRAAWRLYTYSVPARGHIVGRCAAVRGSHAVLRRGLRSQPAFWAADARFGLFPRSSWERAASAGSGLRPCGFADVHIAAALTPTLRPWRPLCLVGTLDDSHIPGTRIFAQGLATALGVAMTF